MALAILKDLILFLNHFENTNFPKHSSIRAHYLKWQLKLFKCINFIGIQSTMEYYKCGDFTFNFLFVNMDEEDVSAERVAQEINIWMDNLPPGKVS
jgi:hypothetical protein